jgi:hypothetical protein
MGTLTLPASGLVYVDTMTLIYTVERFPSYWPLVEPMWLAAQAGYRDCQQRVDTHGGAGWPPQKRHTALEKAFEQALLGTGTRLVPITQPILREAARLRATTKLRTPDAIHPATALHTGCVQFVTNDAAFRGLAGLSLVILDDLLTP